MGSKRHPKFKDYDPDPYSDNDYDYDLEEEFDGIGNLAEDFCSTEWEDPLNSDRKISARRKIERRAEFKALRSQFDDWGDEFKPDSEWY